MKHLSIILPYIVLLLYPIICRFDVSKSTMWAYDTFSMSPNLWWYLLLFSLSVMTSAILTRGLTLAHLIAVVILFSLVELVNYPLTPPNIARDIYFHGSSVNSINSTGRIVDTWVKYPLGYPLFFVLWSVSSIISGIGIREINVLLLLPISVIIMALLLYVFFMKLTKGDKNLAVVSSILSFLLMNFHKNEFTFIFFNTRLLSIILVIIALLFYHETFFKHDRRFAFLLVFTTFGLTLSHALIPLVIVCMIVLHALIERKHVTFFFLFPIMYFSWNAYNAFSSFGVGVKSFFDYFYQILARERLAETFIVVERLPFFGVILRNYYKILVSTLVLFSLTYVIRHFRKERKTRFMSAFLISNMVVFSIAFFTAITGESINRALMVVSISLAFLSLSHLKEPIHLKKRRIIPTLLVIIAVSLMIIPHYALVHEYRSIDRFNNPLESILQFTGSYQNGSISSVGYFFIYYLYYEPHLANYQLFVSTYWRGDPRWELSLADLEDISLFLQKTQGLKIIDMKRSPYEWGSQRVESYQEAYLLYSSHVLSPLNNANSRIYDSSYFIGYYSRAHAEKV